MSLSFNSFGPYLNSPDSSKILSSWTNIRIFVTCNCLISCCRIPLTTKCIERNSNLRKLFSCFDTKSSFEIFKRIPCVSKRNSVSSIFSSWAPNMQDKISWNRGRSIIESTMCSSFDKSRCTQRRNISYLTIFYSISFFIINWPWTTWNSSL